MRTIKLLFSTFAIMAGIFLIVFGEIDDSPGGMFLGLIAIVVGIISVFKNRKGKDQIS